MMLIKHLVSTDEHFIDTLTDIIILKRLT